ncbi:methyltransferase domain-containing protein [bacterium]|nr:methyltransferase domain-containing protein [bacterium]
MNKAFDVGGNSKEIAIASQFDDWQQDVLDIDASQNPDILADARELIEQQAENYDAVYCSHNLEHYYLHDAKKVLIGFRHVLKPDGHAYITVPDLKQVMAQVVNENLDITDVLSQS